MNLYGEFQNYHKVFQKNDMNSKEFKRSCVELIVNFRELPGMKVKFEEFKQIGIKFQIIYYEFQRIPMNQCVMNIAREIKNVFPLHNEICFKKKIIKNVIKIMSWPEMRRQSA